MTRRAKAPARLITDRVSSFVISNGLKRLGPGAVLRCTERQIGEIMSNGSQPATLEGVEQVTILVRARRA